MFYFNFSIYLSNESFLSIYAILHNACKQAFFQLLMPCASQHLVDIALASIHQLLSEGYQHLYEKEHQSNTALWGGILSHHMLVGEF